VREPDSRNRKRFAHGRFVAGPSLHQPPVKWRQMLSFPARQVSQAFAHAFSTAPFIGRSSCSHRHRTTMQRKRIMRITKIPVPFLARHAEIGRGEIYATLQGDLGIIIGWTTIVAGAKGTCTGTAASPRVPLGPTGAEGPGQTAVGGTGPGHYRASARPRRASSL